MKEMTEREALRRLTALCARGEHSRQEMREKMERWQLPEEARERCLERLVREGYVDDERFARAFIHDKSLYDRWGRRKIEQALWRKGVGKDISAPLLDEVEEETYEETLLPMMREKWKSSRGRDERERKAKLVRWALGRGYDYATIRRCAARMELDMEDDRGEDF